MCMYLCACRSRTSWSSSSKRWTRSKRERRERSSASMRRNYRRISRPRSRRGKRKGWNKLRTGRRGRSVQGALLLLLLQVKEEAADKKMYRMWCRKKTPQCWRLARAALHPNIAVLCLPYPRGHSNIWHFTRVYAVQTLRVVLEGVGRLDAVCWGHCWVLLYVHVYVCVCKMTNHLCCKIWIYPTCEMLLGCYEGWWTSGRIWRLKRLQVIWRDPISVRIIR